MSYMKQDEKKAPRDVEIGRKIQDLETKRNSTASGIQAAADKKKLDELMKATGSNGVNNRKRVEEVAKAKKILEAAEQRIEKERQKAILEATRALNEQANSHLKTARTTFEAERDRLEAETIAMNKPIEAAYHDSAAGIQQDATEAIKKLDEETKAAIAPLRKELEALAAKAAKSSEGAVSAPADVPAVAVEETAPSVPA